MVKEGGILMVSGEPYFMKNKEWYFFDEIAFMYKLTDKAPQEAVDSYNEYYKNVYNGSMENERG